MIFDPAPRHDFCAYYFTHIHSSQCQRVSLIIYIPFCTDSEFQGISKDLQSFVMKLYPTLSILNKEKYQTKNPPCTECSLELFALSLSRPKKDTTQSPVRSSRLDVTAYKSRHYPPGYKLILCRMHTKCDINI